MENYSERLAATLFEQDRAREPVGVLLDLRGNGGGSTDGAEGALSIFLPGAALFPMKRRDGEIEVDRAPRPSHVWKGPVAALVDHFVRNNEADLFHIKTDDVVQFGGLEYRVLQLDAKEAGEEEAKLAFDVGQGSQDLGFRNAVPILFVRDVRWRCQPYLTSQNAAKRAPGAALTVLGASGGRVTSELRRSGRRGADAEG